MRVSTLSTFQRVLSGLRKNQFRAVNIQEQIASGKRLLRPSDDPEGAGRALRLRRQLAEIGRNREAIARGQDALGLASDSLQEGSNLIINARELVLQALNGTLSDVDREAFGAEFELLREQMLDVANLRFAGRYIFGGTVTDSQPFVQVQDGDSVRTVYVGNEDSQRISVAPEVEVSITSSGNAIFGQDMPTGVALEGLTGIALGTTANQGTREAGIVVRHDSTDLGTAGSVGIALVDGGSGDTLMGDNTLTIDATLRTVQLGNGPVVELPGVGAPQLADVVVENELGGELRLDFAAFTDTDFTGVVRGDGSISLDGQTFAPLTFTETDLELRDDAEGVVLHVDTTGIGRAGTEHAVFGGTLNVFDVLAGISNDLENDEGVERDVVFSRLRQRLTELDQAHSNLLRGLSDIGARSVRLESTDIQRQEVELSIQGLLSSVEDADLSEVALELARADTVFQFAQASGARLIQTSLLNFLR